MPFIKKMRRGQIKGNIKNLVLIMFLKGLMDVQKQVRSWSSGEKRRPEIDCSIINMLWLVIEARR